MKTINKISFLTTVLIVAFTIQSSYVLGSEKSKKADQQDFITLKGKVVDAETGEALVFATVAVSESNVAITTNIDGEFTLKVGNALISQNLEVSYLGRAVVVHKSEGAADHAVDLARLAAAMTLTVKG